MTQHPQPLTYPIAQLERRFTAFAIDRLLAWSLLAATGVLTVVLVSDEVWTVVGVVGDTRPDPSIAPAKNEVERAGSLGVLAAAAPPWRAAEAAMYWSTHLEMMVSSNSPGASRRSAAT